jgi:hypothetical protein
MPHPRGKPFTTEEKNFIVKLKRYFDRNKTESGPKDSSVQKTADALVSLKMKSQEIVISQ